jgi:hypothetical protein
MGIIEKKHYFILIIFLLYFIPSSILIISGYGKGSNYADQMEYHLPTINKYSQDWPNLDLHEHGAASAPGYHIVLGILSRYFVVSTTSLQFFGVLITIGFLITMFLGLDKRVNTRLAFFLTIPLIYSIYIFQAGVWIMNDNPAIWCVLGMLLIGLRPRVDKWTYILGGLILFILVNIRQIHIWTASILWVLAFIGPVKELSLKNIRNGVIVHQKILRKRLLFSFIATLPAFLSLFYYIRIWGGFTPPKFKSFYSISTINPSFFFTLFSIYGIFFIPYFFNELCFIVRTKYKSILLVLSLGFIISVLPHSNYSTAAHRYGGLWNFVPHFPVIHERSPIFIIGGSLGIVFFYIISESLKIRKLLRERLILSFCLFAFLAAHLVTYPFQRYYEPFLLILLSFIAAYLYKHSHTSLIYRERKNLKQEYWVKKGKYIGPIILALFLGVLTFVTLI